MWIDRLCSSRTTHAIALTAQFAEQRHKVLAENVANVDTPNYRTKRLDPQAFQASLSAALDLAREKQTRRLELRGNAQFSTGANGRMKVRPAESPADNILFQDGTNARLERLLADVAENNMSYDLATNLLRSRYQQMLRAIRGRVE